MAKKPPNENIGEIICPACDEKMAGIRQYKTGKKSLYTYCPDCGTTRSDGKAFQDKILNNGKFFSPGDKPKQEAKPAPDQAAPAKPKEDKRSFLDKLWNGSGDDE